MKRAVQTDSAHEGVGARISRYFIQNPSITLLCFALLLVGGVASFLLLRTSGFPSANISLVAVTTVYPGASAGTVEQRVSIPLETAVKSIDGVDTVTAQSRDSVSTLVINLESDADVPQSEARIRSAVDGATLPSEVEPPTVTTPDITADQFVYVLSPVGDATSDDTYEAVRQLRQRLLVDPGVENVTIPGDFIRTVKVTFDPGKLADEGLDVDSAVAQVSGFGLQLPVKQQADIADREQGVAIVRSGGDIAALRDFELRATGPGASMAPTRLGDVAQVAYSYDRGDGKERIAGYREDETAVVTDATYIGVGLGDVDIQEYRDRIDAIMNSYLGTSAQRTNLTDEQRALFAKFDLKTVYSEADRNDTQIQEIVAGMVGEKWDIGPIGYIGFLFGAIQLVFILMLLLVSWRAALAATLAIPLSFFFSTIVVLVTGNDLNTLVLFTLVLVIGLVVDPALVVLEVIQRKIDAGQRGSEAVLAGIREVGPSLLLTVVNSIIVFVPFGVVSGFFGEIISYIPLTIIPALVGSYLVPLVFLSFIASRFLRPTVSRQVSEETENLWPVARATMAINRWTLSKPWFVQTPLVVAALALPLLVAGVFVGTGLVKVTQFAQPGDSPYVNVTAIERAQRTDTQRAEDTRALFKAILENETVEVIAPTQFAAGGSDGVQYTLELTGTRDLTANQIAAQLNDRLSQPDIASRYFDVDAVLAAAGPPNEAFAVTISLTDVPESQRQQKARELSQLLMQVCRVSKNTFEVRESCGSGDKVVAKVNDGFGALGAKSVEIAIKTGADVPPIQPLSLQTTIRSAFGEVAETPGAPAVTVRAGQENIEVAFAADVESPDTLDRLRDLPVTTVTGQTIPLSDVADVRESPAGASLTRVNGQNIVLVTAKPKAEFDEQLAIAGIQQAAIDAFNDRQGGENVADSDVPKAGQYSEGVTSTITKSFGELGVALLIAIVSAYLIQVIFFRSLTLPLVVIFTIPLAFLGMFPALALLAGGQLGLFEIIGFIILIGLVVNVAIFLMSLANQKVDAGQDRRSAIVEASGIRFRPIILTKLTVLISLAPLAILSEDYRALAVVVMFGLLTSGIVSLFVVPSLYMLATSTRPQFVSRRRR